MRSRIFISMISIGVSTSYARKLQRRNKNVISDYAKTKYPLVFVHGMFGFSRVWVRV
jgi:triacylglycerol lipase